MNLLKGFTLIEVLLALTIIALGMMAAIRTTEATTGTLFRIQERTLAEWVGQNALVAMKLHINGLSPVAGRWKSTSEQAGRIWYWEATSQATSNPSILQITVEVRADDKQEPLSTIISYWPIEQL